MIRWQRRRPSKVPTEYTDWVTVKNCRLAVWPPRSLVPGGPRPDMWYFCMMVPINYENLDKVLRPTPAQIARGSKQYANFVDGFAETRGQAMIILVQRAIEAFRDGSRFTEQFRPFSKKVRRGVIRELKQWLGAQKPVIRRETVPAAAPAEQMNLDKDTDT